MNRFEFDVIWVAFQHSKDSDILVPWRFCRISAISEFSFLGFGLETKTRKSQKIFICGPIIFGSISGSIFGYYFHVFEC